MMQLGVLDFGLVAPGETVRSTLAATMDAAKLAERIGYTRYWLGEHYFPSCAWNEPAAVIPLIADGTSSIRVGVGGALLSIHSPASIAGHASLLAHLFPGRVDLGLARAPGPGAMAPPHPSWYERGVEAIRACLTRNYLAGTPIDCVPPPPDIPPEMWVLGSSRSSVDLAAGLGLPLAVSLFHSERPNVDAVAAYRPLFLASDHAVSAQLAVAVAGVCAATESEARAEFARRTNRLAWPNVIGTPERWANDVGALVATLQPDILLIVDLAATPGARLASLELLAGALCPA